MHNKIGKKKKKVEKDERQLKWKEEGYEQQRERPEIGKRDGNKWIRGERGKKRAQNMGVCKNGNTLSNMSDF